MMSIDFRRDPIRSRAGRLYLPITSVEIHRELSIIQFAPPARRGAAHRCVCVTSLVGICRRFARIAISQFLIKSARFLLLLLYFLAVNQAINILLRYIPSIVRNQPDYQWHFAGVAPLRKRITRGKLRTA